VETSIKLRRYQRPEMDRKMINELLRLPYSEGGWSHEEDSEVVMRTTTRQTSWRPLQVKKSSQLVMLKTVFLLVVGVLIVHGLQLTSSRYAVCSESGPYSLLRLEHVWRQSFPGTLACYFQLNTQVNKSAGGSI